jgi:hypothetical protein
MASTPRLLGPRRPAEQLVVEEVLAANACKAVVATSALGMGYKPDNAFQTVPVSRRTP